MSATTVNAFPPLHAFNSSRAWFLALIVLVHVGFFWALSNGCPSIVQSAHPRRRWIVDFLTRAAEAKPPPKQPEPPDVSRAGASVPIPLPAATFRLPSATENAPIVVSRSSRRAHDGQTGAASPRAAGHRRTDDRSARRPERAGVSGLGNSAVARRHGVAVGERSCRTGASARCASISRAATRSSMSPRCAKRERWRMKPGMQDGVAAAMWKHVPITFRLKN